MNQHENDFGDKRDRQMPPVNLSAIADMQTILDYANEGFVLTDLHGNIRAFNKQAKESILKNVHSEVTIGSNIYEFIDASRREEYTALLKRVANGEQIEYNRSFERPNGKKAWFEFWLAPVVENGEVTAICMRGKDITGVKESELLYHSLFEKGPLPMFICDRKTLRYLEINEAVITHYGYSRDELMQMSPFDIRVAEEYSSLYETIEKGPGIWDRATIGTHRKKNGDLISVQVALLPIDYMGSEATLVVVTDVTELMTLQQQLANEKLSRQQEVTRATIEAQEKERFILGTELHENINQMLSSAKLFLNYALTQPDDQRSIVEKSIDTLETVIQEVSKLSRSLLPPSLGDLGLAPALRELIKSMTFRKGTIRLQGLKMLGKLSVKRDMELCIYRIIQEQLTNVEKYANCTEVTICFERTRESLILTISDNGQGFDVNAKHDGIGLSNITNRASAFKAPVNINSNKGEGTTLTVTFPF